MELKHTVTLIIFRFPMPNTQHKTKNDTSCQI